MAAPGFIIDASEAEALMKDLAVKRGTMIAKVQTITLNHARQMRASVRAKAPRGPHTKGFANSIDTRTKRLAAGVECTIEAKSSFGTILEFGTATSRPWNMFGSTADAMIPLWEQAVGDAVADLL